MKISHEERRFAMPSSVIRDDSSFRRKELGGLSKTTVKNHCLSIAYPAYDQTPKLLRVGGAVSLGLTEEGSAERLTA